MDDFTEVYSKSQSDKIAAEFSRLKDNYYLEHVGVTLYSDKQIENIFMDLKNNLFGNPHAFNTSSKFTEDTIDQIRYQVLNHFNTTLDEYSLIFTSGATAALKLVAENFNYSSDNTKNCDQDGCFSYLEDNHTSVLGMRENANSYKILSHNEAFKIFNSKNFHKNASEKNFGNSLFVYSAQCNFSGVKYPLSWIEKVQNGILDNEFCTKSKRWFCMLDAASFVSCNKLDLNLYKPDFVCLSFYKIFGYPTGLGALLVKNSSAFVLKKAYFGGGTVQMVLPNEHVPRIILHERFEDGTLPFLSIASIRHGFETWKRLSLNIDLISQHTFSLAKYLHHNLLLMHHFNENPVAILYHDTDFENRNHQGAVVNFNLLRDNGKFIGYSEVLQMANLYKIHLRTGCFCNPGSCQRHLKLSPQIVKQQFDAGHVCGDQNDLVDDYPTGSVRVSFGYMSTKKDADKLLEMINDCFVSKPLIKKLPNSWEKFQKIYKEFFVENKSINSPGINKNSIALNSTCNLVAANSIRTQTENLQICNDFNNLNLNNNNNIPETNLQYIFVYPIKSCGAYLVEDKWRIESTGLSYDREWMVVTSSGVCLTQKREPKMCLIRPIIKLSPGVLELNYPGMNSINVPIKIDPNVISSEASLCQSKVCGDRVNCFDCGDKVAEWLCNALQRPDLRLLRENENHIRTNRKGERSQLSLVNQAQYLLLNTGSINYLANEIQDYEVNEDSIFNLISRFRANLVIKCDIPFIEQSWSEIKIGENIFKCTGLCARCQMICIDQSSGEKTIEPLRTLSVLTENKIRFGIYLEHISPSAKHIQRNEKVVFQ